MGRAEEKREGLLKTEAIRQGEAVILAESLRKEYRLYDTPGERFRGTLLGEGHTPVKRCGALDDITFFVRKGQATGIIGENGAGKSTLLKLITGVLKPDGGTLSIGGKVSALLELGAGFRPDYTGIENVILTGRLQGIARSEMEKRLPRILEFAEIGDYADRPVKTYSSGMFARLAFAAATNVDADILIVDEALSVGDTFFQNRCFRKFEELKKEGVTLLLVSHDLETVRRMTERAIWLEKGCIRMEGESREVCNAYAAEIHRKEDKDHLRKADDRRENTKVFSPGENPAESGWVFNPEDYPPVRRHPGDITCSRVKILSCCFENDAGETVPSVTCGEPCSLVIIFEAMEDIPECICGYVLQNRKGLSLINSNTLTVPGGRTFRAEAGEIYRVTFSLCFPYIYEDQYLVDCAVADGPSVMDNEMLSWHYGAAQVMVRNDRPCLALIDVPAKVSVLKGGRKLAQV